MSNKSGLAAMIYYAYYGISHSIIEYEETLGQIVQYLNLPENEDKRISDLIVGWEEFASRYLLRQ